MIKHVPQIGQPTLSSYLSIISVWSLTQFDFIINLNLKSVILNGIELLKIIVPLYFLQESLTLAAPSNPDYPDYFQTELLIIKPCLSTYL